MRLVLVNPPSCFRDVTDLAPPLGLLTLATVAEQLAGWETNVLDFNLDMAAGSSPSQVEDFYDWAVPRISALGPDAVGFTSMCLESHVALELAGRVKAQLPGVVTIFGGSHFGSIAEELLVNFPAVDYVIRGEAERALAHLLRSIASGAEREHDCLPSVVFGRKTTAGVPFQGSRYLGEVDLDAQPFPDFTLINLEAYFSLNPRRLLLYEAGRGCIFNCSFCYSPNHHGRGFRDRSPSRILEDLVKLAELGASHVFFVQDNFINSPEWALAICDLIAREDLPFTWSCYATLPQLNSRLIESLSKAKCTGIFFGLDAIDASAQSRLGKHFVRDWETSIDKLRCCINAGILPTCAFILEPISGSGSDAVMRAALDCRNLGCDVHINTLVVYNQTEINRREQQSESGLFYSTLKAELLLDTSAVVAANPLAEKLPDLFPYHVGCGEPINWEKFVVGAFVLHSVVYAFPKSFEVWLDEGGSTEDLVARIDKQMIDALRGSNPLVRRATALRWAGQRLMEDLSNHGQDILRREVAAFILACGEPKYLIRSLRQGEEREGLARNCLNVKGREVSDFLGVAEVPRGGFGEGEIALRFDERIEFLRATKDLYDLVASIGAACHDGLPLKLDDAALEYLERNDWLKLG